MSPKKKHKKHKGKGWIHPKTGEWWSSKKDYHKYWAKYIKPQCNKKQSHSEPNLESELEEGEEFWVSDPNLFYLKYIKDDD